MNLNTVTLSILLFFVIIPLAIRMWRGRFWSNVYITVSSVVGAICMSWLPQALLEQALGEAPGWVEPLKNLMSWIPTPLFTAVAFIFFFLMQKAVVKLVDLTGWLGE